MTSGRTAVLGLAALAMGVVVALIDSSPGWDSDGITAGLLFLGAGGATVLAAGRRPWLWAMLVGLPTPIVEIARSGNAGSVLAFAFALVGAGAGWALTRAA